MWAATIAERFLGVFCVPYRTPSGADSELSRRRCELAEEALGHCTLTSALSYACSSFAIVSALLTAASNRK